MKKTAGQFHIVGSYWLLHFVMCSAVRGAEPFFSPFHHTFAWHRYVLRPCMNNIPISIICYWGNHGEKKKKTQLIIEFLNVFRRKKKSENTEFNEMKVIYLLIYFICNVIHPLRIGIPCKLFPMCSGTYIIIMSVHCTPLGYTKLFFLFFFSFFFGTTPCSFIFYWPSLVY